jgi:hypothetical protein
MAVVTGSDVEIEIREEKVFTHLNKDKERKAGTWVLDIGVTNHISGSELHSQSSTRRCLTPHDDHHVCWEQGKVVQ